MQFSLSFWVVAILSHSQVTTISFPRVGGRRGDGLDTLENYFHTLMLLILRYLSLRIEKQCLPTIIYHEVAKWCNGTGANCQSAKIMMDAAPIKTVAKPFQV